MSKFLDCYDDVKGKYLNQFSRVLNKVKEETILLADQIPEKTLINCFKEQNAHSCNIWRQKNGEINYFLGLTRGKLNVTEGYQNAVDELKNLFKDNYPGLEILESYDIALISNAFVFHVERGIIKDADEDEGKGKEEKASLSIVRYILDINSMENYFLDENIEIESFDEGVVILTTKLH